jgi:hypothetical protein
MVKNEVPKLKIKTRIANFFNKKTFWKRYFED